MGGTPFYNYYLRLCSVRVSSSAHINTTAIDPSYLLEISNETWVTDQTLLNCFHFNNVNTFQLYPIRIGCDCSIGTRSILFVGVDMKDDIIIQPMSSVTGSTTSKIVIDGGEHKPISSSDYTTHSAHIQDNVKLSDIGIFPSCPTNLLELETGVTTFASLLIVPTGITLSGDHRTDRITFGTHTNLAKWMFNFAW
ncbi:unnamed protein product [Adineta steineri]|uniref:Uncharacterized protein n=1 Tax=Adineta steineri TaxID=433720 RepID=A0A816C713_9BILA|nr:unnamed protein product [Adineta steineri]CAF1620385.1 unnamed protein product [Adineta steineri]